MRGRIFCPTSLWVTRSLIPISESAEAALVLLTGQEENKPNFRDSAGALLTGVVGAGGSSLSIAASRPLGLYYLPQVSQIIVLGTNL